MEIQNIKPRKDRDIYRIDDNDDLGIYHWIIMIIQ